MNRERKKERQEERQEKREGDRKREREEERIHEIFMSFQCNVLSLTSHSLIVRVP